MTSKIQFSNKILVLVSLYEGGVSVKLKCSGSQSNWWGDRSKHSLFFCLFAYEWALEGKCYGKLLGTKVRLVNIKHSFEYGKYLKNHKYSTPKAFISFPSISRFNHFWGQSSYQHLTGWQVKKRVESIQQYTILKMVIVKIRSIFCVQNINGNWFAMKFHFLFMYLISFQVQYSIQKAFLSELLCIYFFIVFPLFFFLFIFSIRPGRIRWWKNPLKSEITDTNMLAFIE